MLFVLIFAQWASAQNPLFLSDKIAHLEKENNTLKSLFVEKQSNAETDFIYQRMEWDINPAFPYIKGKITTYFKSKTDNLGEVIFDLAAGMTVDSILQQNNPVAFQRDSNTVIVPLVHKLGYGQIDSVAVFYGGSPGQSGFGSFVQDFHGEDSIPIIWTLSEPYGALEWWPCKQSLSDKIDSIDVIVSSPKTYSTASNGILVSETVTNNTRTMHWKHRYPIATYLVAVAVTNYERYSDFLELEDGREIEILNYVYPENKEKAQSQTPITANIIELFNRLLGEYPFASEKYGHAQFGWGGGMEHQTMSFVGDFSFGLIAHELAHQWFGDYITLGSWQHIWLNEGFATYLTGLSYENLAEPQHWPIWKKVNKEKVLSQPGGSVFVDDTSSVSRIFDSRLSYAKGGLLLHMQRWIVGDSLFFMALQNYFSDEKIANGFAFSEDWIRQIEATADTNLTAFFNDWLYNEGYPIYSINYKQQKPDSLVVELSQTTSHESVDFFELPVPIRVYGNNKTDSADFRLNNIVNHQTFILNPGFIIDEIVIDPEDWIICQTDKITGNAIIETENELVVFPNPGSDKISFFLTNNQTCIQTRVYSVSGSLLKQIQGNKSSVDIANLPTGTYILQLETSSSVFTKKIVKQ